jgi:hypothetical protein
MTITLRFLAATAPRTNGLAPISEVPRATPAALRKKSRRLRLRYLASSCGVEAALRSGGWIVNFGTPHKHSLFGTPHKHSLFGAPHKHSLYRAPKAFEGLRPIVFGPRPLRRTWGTRPGKEAPLFAQAKQRR